MKAAAASLVIALVWLGMLIGVSFIATPVKFAAPSLTLPVALDVGRQTFAVFSRVEAVLALALVGAALPVGKWGLLTVVLVTGMAVSLQVFWILPALDARVTIILAGGTPPPSSLHWVYISLDALKLALLGLAALVARRAV